MDEKFINLKKLDKLRQEIEINKVIEEKINPKLEEHKGWVEFVDFINNVIYVRFRGACSGCASTYETMDNLVKPVLSESFKELENVEIVSEVSNDMLNFAKSLFAKKNNYN